MSSTIVFAKMAALYKEVRNRQEQVPNDEQIFDYLSRYRRLREQIIETLPDLYSDLPDRPEYSQDPNYDFENRNDKPIHFFELIRDMEYIFEVRANSELASEIDHHTDNTEPLTHRIFISHGRSSDWREVQAYIEKDLNIETLELAQRPNQGRTVLQKLKEESDKCCFAVVLMTGDDDLGGGAPRARENVLHEIGFFQGKFGLDNVCLLYEEGTNIPSNIHGLVYIPFPKGLVSAGFGVLARELKATLSKTQ